MSHQLLSKKIWISALVLTVMFLALTYAWFYYTNQLVLQAEIAERSDHKTKATAENVSEAAWQLTEPIETKDEALTFPCTLQMKDGEIGVYNEEGVLCQQMRQIGELLSEQDRIQLIQGIQAEDQQALVALFESYHLQ